jgi:predicted DNA-binding transcriptional regulator AlpA
MAIRYLRRPEVLILCRFSASTLHREIRAGRFPRPIRISPRLKAWDEAEVEARLIEVKNASRDEDA